MNISFSTPMSCVKKKLAQSRLAIIIIIIGALQDPALAQPKPDNLLNRDIRYSLWNSANLTTGRDLCMIIQGGKVACASGYRSALFHRRGGTSGIITEKAAWRIIPNLRDAVALSSGFNFACALTRSRTVRCWGKSPSSEKKRLFGIEEHNDLASHVEIRTYPVNGLNGNISEISVDPSGLCVKFVSGPIKCMNPYTGDISWTALGMTPRQVSAIIGRESGKCVLSNSGSVRCLLSFENKAQELWNGNRLFSGPIQRMSCTGGGETYTTIAGLNHNGKLEMCMPDHAPKCIKIANAPQNIVDFKGHCVLTLSGEVWCWGEPDTRPISETIEATNMKLPEPAINLSAGQNKPCARLASGKVACFRWTGPTDSELVPGAVIFDAPNVQ